METSTGSGAKVATTGRRLVSLDALRGFDMFWIIGAGALVGALNRMGQTPATKAIGAQLQHAPWEGFRFYDLVFPLFVFIVGVSMVFSLGRLIEEAGRKAALLRILRRTVVLYLLGIFYYGGVICNWPEVRLLGVLQRIALAYMGAGFLFCFLKGRAKALAVVWVGLLVGYWALLTFAPIRDIQLTNDHLAALASDVGDETAADLFHAGGNWSIVKDSAAWAAARKMYFATEERVSGVYDQGRNVADHFDFLYLPGWKADTFNDPEGLLSTIPAVATCLLGALAGLLLQARGIAKKRKALLLAAAGVALVGLGWTWGISFPVVKKIWTSSFVLVAGGYSLLLLAAFYQVVEVWEKRRWCQPFVWMGMNAITIYLVVNIINFRILASHFAGGDVSDFLDEHVAKGCGDLAVALVSLALAFLLVWFLHRRKIYLRV